MNKGLSMPRRIWIMALLAALLLVGCADTLVVDTPTQATGSTPVATLAPTVPPEEMPTAVPVFTATPEPTMTPVPVATATLGQTPPTPTLDAALAAMVDGEPISQEAYQAQLQQAEKQFMQQPGFEATSEEGQAALALLREQVLGWMIDRTLMLQAAPEMGIDVSEDAVEAQIALMRGDDAARFEKWLTASGLTYQALQEQVRSDLLASALRDRVTGELGRTALQARVRHIWLSQRQVADEVLAQLREGANFIVMARQYSEDEATRAKGGDLGFLPQGAMPPAFEAVAFGLAPGEISGIVESASGYHIIQMVEIDPQRPVPDNLWPLVQQHAFEQWLAERRAVADIQRN